MDLRPPPDHYEEKDVLRWQKDLYEFLKKPVFPGGLNVGDATNYLDLGNTGNAVFVGTAGLSFGSCYGNEIAWAQAAAVQNTWYDVSDATMVDGNLNLVAHDGNGKLTVTNAGMYLAVWSVASEVDAANQHIQIAFSINGTETANGMNHYESFGASKQFPISGNAILDLAASDTVNVSIRTTDAGTPDLAIDHLMITLVQTGGT